MFARGRLVGRLTTIVLLLSLLLVTTGGAVGAAGTVVATGLANPRGIAVGEDGTLYVSEAGLSGTETFTPPPPYPPSTRGNTGRVTRIAPGGAKSTVATDLPSLSLGGNGNAFVLGPAGLVMAGGALWLANGAMVNGHPPAPNAATLLRIDPRTGAVSTGADVAAYERERNPDGFELTSNPYGLTLGPDGNLYATDAGGNALYRIRPSTGELTLVTVFAGLPGAAANPQRGGESELDPVPTGVAAGPDGSLYVGLESGEPFPAGAAKVVRVARDGTVGDVAVGLTAVVALAVGPDRLVYVVEFGSFDHASQPPDWKLGSGRVLRLRADGTTQAVADELDAPNGIAFDRAGNLYVIVKSSTAPQAGPQGQVVRFDGVAAGGTAPRTPVQLPTQLPRTGSSDGPPWAALAGIGLLLAGLGTRRAFGRRS
jgi:LPXTG-motif cell wall-anchored protein